MFQLEHVLKIYLCIELMFSAVLSNHEASNFVLLLPLKLMLLSKHILEKIANILKFMITVLELESMLGF